MIKKLLRYIQDTKTEKGHAPTHAEMKRYLGIKSSQIMDTLLKELELNGHIKRNKGIPRGIEVLKPTAISFASVTSLWKVWSFDGSN